MNSFERHDIPFAISEDYDWIAVPGHIGWVAATAVVDSTEEEILEGWTGEALRVSWKKGWVVCETNEYNGLPWWLECNSKDDGAEPAMIWQDLR
jgi:hypothetical protein